METPSPTPDLVRESYDRCLASGDFVGTFYDLFLASHESVVGRFAQTDFVKQKALLRSSILMMIKWDSGEQQAREHVAAVATSHSRHALDIPPHLYELWLQCLLATIRRHDPQCDARIESAWTQRLIPAIDFIVARY